MKVGRRTLIGAGVAGVAALGLAQVIGPGSEVATPGRSRARAFPTDARPPAEADVVVIGGGNAGAATAYYLAKQGLKVVLCEKGAIAGEASGRAVGHIYSPGTPPEDLPFTYLSQNLWRGLNQELGIETGYRERGLVMEVTEKDHPFWEEWIRAASGLGAQVRLLSSSEVAQYATVREPWFAGLYLPADGTAEPTLLAPAYAEAAQRLGAKIVAPCAVRGLELSGGKVSGVVTEHGPIRTNTVVLAGGAWSTAFMKSLDFSLPTGAVFAWCSSFHIDGPQPAAAAIFQDTTYRQQIDGGFTTSLRGGNAPITPQLIRYAHMFMGALMEGPWPVHPRLGGYTFEQLFTPSKWKLDEVSPFEKRRILEPALDQMVIDKAQKRMRDNVPAFANMRVTDTWGGCMSMSGDMLPMVGPVDQIPGLVLATGLGGEGLTLGPAVGLSAANIITGKPVEPLVARLNVRRFGERPLGEQQRPPGAH